MEFMRESLHSAAPIKSPADAQAHDRLRPLFS
jgi:hypothetical protein